ncbi:MAG: nucleotide sugar dehydrogenase [Chitinophagales bacterium]|jgi:UDP-N-acetyl-D-galactosamine dehydrogenase|nr:nucleotide sugar dehydrogenase [Chitinophagales bacterium]
MKKIAVIGLGYVGLPLAKLFASKYAVIGLDINQERIEALRKGIDVTDEVSKDELKGILKTQNDQVKGLFLTENPEDIATASIYIVTVPTPVDEVNKPDLKPLIEASKMLGKFIKANDIVIYESTVYPGVTEDVCIPHIEQSSGLTYNQDFFAGYSPERINPGDKDRPIEKIQKITSGSTPDIAQEIDDLYNSVLLNGTYMASSIKVAEAAKVIENSQRDLNIAFVNELAIVFERIGIDTQEVLAAAATKWNFLKFQPGLVGGHCIGVDPYYLAHQAIANGYIPEIILAGRRVNDAMGSYISSQVIKLMLQKQISITNSKILVLGFTFKENCPDFRNTKVYDMVKDLEEYKTQVYIYDPHVDITKAKEEYQLNHIDNKIPQERFDAIILAVSHDEFRNLDLEMLKKENSLIYDIKAFFPKEIIDARL